MTMLINTPEALEKKKALLGWAASLKMRVIYIDSTPITSAIRHHWDEDLRNYWNLALLSRAEKDFPLFAPKAKQLVFKVRVKIERGIEASLKESIGRKLIEVRDCFKSTFFSESIKQGLSVRMPLSSCKPTSNCHWSCYAHDGMDAGRYPIIKGAINGVIASLYETGTQEEKNAILSLLRHPTTLAIKKALGEKKRAGFERDPRIRFSHVGEIAQFPKFSNAFAKLVKELSEGQVRCVVYTRHSNAKLLDPDLFVVNFTLDRDSEDRMKWVPVNARKVFTAWDGECESGVAVNFLEHHRFSHAEVKGSGHVCPVTVPNTNLKTCDAAKCDLCFRRTEREI